jgi:MYXO-CTERM domain-containing protein
MARLLAIGLGLVLATPALADQVVQVPADGVLDGRSVSTLTGGMVVPWTTGIDKDDAYMTLAAAKSLGQAGPALPDDGKFAANATHPEVVLHFSNAAPAAAPQTHLQTAMGAFVVPVPRASYSKVFLFLTASYGDAPLAIKMSYADGTSTMTTFTLPDWGTGKALPTSPAIFFNLIGGLQKWTKTGMNLDTPAHTITGVTLTPAGDRTLTSIEVNKTTAAPWLTFWGATGIATSAVGGGMDAGADVTADAAAEVAAVRDAEAEQAPEPAAEPTPEPAAEPTPEPAAEPTPEPAAEAGAPAPEPHDAGVVEVAAAPVDAARPPARSSGGCSVAGASEGSPLALALAVLLASRRRRRPAV